MLQQEKGCGWFLNDYDPGILSLLFKLHPRHFIGNFYNE